MQEITSSAGLKNAIQLLESEQAVSRQLLKEQFFITYESLKPISLLKSAIRDISSSPDLFDNLSGNAIGLASGYLTKKIIVGSSANIVRKLLGSVLQFGVTNLVAQHSDTIKALIQIMVQHFVHKKEDNSQKT